MMRAWAEADTRTCTITAGCTKGLQVVVLMWLVVFLPLNVSWAQINAPRNPKSAKACALCHYRWIDTFFVEGKGTDLVPYQSRKVVATPEMCASCHDGSIMDSRDRMSVGRGHKTGVAPPSGMRIPDVFPLDDNGKVQCATCHTAHGVPSGPGAETTIFMRTTNKDSAMCRMCHDDKLSARMDRNHPMGKVQRAIPRKFLRPHATPGKKVDKITCESCHTAHGSTTNAYLARSSRDASLCLACHTDKAMLTPQGQKKPGHVVNAKPVTAKIPTTLLEKGAQVGASGEVICGTCHRVHGQQTGQHLLIMRDDQNATLCLTCHTDKLSLVKTGHNLIKSAPKAKNLQGQTAAQAGICSACHLPHKPARDLAPGGDYTTGMCMSCHGKERFAARPLIFGQSHPLGVTPKDAAAPNGYYSPALAPRDRLSLPLYDRYGVPSRNGKVTCATCHDPHRLQAVGKTTSSDESGTAPKPKNLFLRQNPPEMCRQCHGDKFAVIESKHNLAKTAPKELNRLKQTPRSAGICGSCHLVHGGEGPFLWAKKIPTTDRPSNPFVCFSCHRDKGAAAKKPIHANSHPIDVAPSEHGLDTRLPLFAPDGKHAADGRVACYTCHDPHRWQSGSRRENEDPMGEGDAVTSFLRISNAPAARLCTDCHREQARVENSDHDLNASAPEIENNQGQKPAQSGACSACHVAHNGKSDFLLWAREITPGSDQLESVCRACHQKSGPAEGKVPEIATHPQDITFRNIGRSTKGRTGYFPLFDPSDGREIPNGQLTCLSCHSGHQWRPESAGQALMGPEEGNAGSSFLRNISSDTICRDCHGSEGLYRYLYFHDPLYRNPSPAEMGLTGP